MPQHPFTTSPARSIARAALALTATAGLGLSLTTTAQSAPTDPGKSASKDDAMTTFVMERDGKSRAQAEAYLDTKEDKQAAMRALEKKGVGIDGAYFKGTRLVVVVDSAADAAAAKKAGLTPSRAAGQSDLDARAKKVLKAVEKHPDAITTVGSDLTKGVVDVRVAADAPRSVVAKLKGMKGVDVSTGDKLTTHADLYPGRIMDLIPGTNCSLGYPGVTSSGKKVMLTAGHCVEGYPQIADAYGNILGRGSATRFRTGYSSVDMGLVDLSASTTPRAQVDGRNGSYYAIKGMSKNAIGSEICKAGNTTGWTCGYIKAYNRTVNYGGTYVSGLAEASVCTEGGDSGGAYIGAGNLAQGMTSGGPMGVECGYNRGHSAGSYSFYQPVVDAASYYGVRINTAQ